MAPRCCGEVISRMRANCCGQRAALLSGCIARGIANDFAD